MCGVLKILMYRSKTREVKCSKCKETLEYILGFAPKVESMALVGQETHNISCSEYPMSESDLQKGPAISWAVCNFYWLSEHTVWQTLDFRLQVYPECQLIIASVSRVAACIPVCPGTGVPIVRNLKITDLGWFSHHSARCYCYLQHFHKVDHHGQMEIM